MATVITGMVALLRNIEKAKAAAVKGAERGVDRARLAVETTAKNLILKGAKTGAIYARIPGEKWMVVRKGGLSGGVVAVFPVDQGRNLSLYHTASAPGQSPASDTGILATSIESKREGLNAVVWTEKPYSKWLEFGTRKIAPRPFMAPAVAANKERFPKELGAAVIESIDGALKGSGSAGGDISSRAARKKTVTDDDYGWN